MGSIKRKAFLGAACCLGLWAFSFQSASAQTFAEWFSQKKTQLKYLTQQIAALEQYGSYVKQGYAISQNGLGNIGGYIKGEYSSHTAYYNALKSVNPAIKGNGKADSIISYAAQIPGQFDHLGNLSDAVIRIGHHGIGRRDDGLHHAVHHRNDRREQHNRHTQSERAQQRVEIERLGLRDLPPYP